MKGLRKKRQGISLYPRDWARIQANLGPEEGQIDLIQAALQHEFEIREGKARLQYMATLTA